MNFGRATWFVLLRLGLTAVGGALAGWLLGHVLAGMAITLALVLAWQFLQLFWLDQWLRGRSRMDPPNASGTWGDVVSQVVRLHRRKGFHKQRLLDVFRELRRSTAAMPDGVVVLNRDWEITWFNHMAGRLLGLRRRNDLRMRITNLVRDPDFLRYLQSADFSEPVTIARDTGSAASHLAFQVVPYGSNQRLMLVRNVTRQVALESMRKDFVANASHELRSPLTVVTGYLETLLQDEPVDSSSRGPLQEMQRQAQRMNGIVNDLLELSRLDALAEEPVGEEIDVQAMCALLRKDVLARPLHPDIRVEMHTEARLIGDEPEILSAFSNLVDNAAKYTPASGSMVLAWRLDDAGRARFSVTDTGPGIAAEHLPRLTERFYRVDAGRARSAGGAGLGLAIVKHVMLHHGGTLEVESTEGVGSCFTCIFPARRVSRVAPNVTIPHRPKSAAGG
jgi:two-component system, OmpR family, phosphate regulon sensor histidine kinase PhoR